MKFFRKIKAQVAALMVLAIVIVILAVGATMLIGELGYQKIRLANTADAAIISAATELARTLNLIRQTHYRLLLNHIRIQVMLLARLIWTSKGEAVAFAIGYVEGLKRGQQLVDQAKDMANDTPKNIRTALLERVFGSQVDEIKPYYRNASGNLDVERYSKEETAFTKTFRNFKKGQGAYAGNALAGKDHWYFNDTLSYSWNRTVRKIGEDQKDLVPGTLVIGDAEPVAESGGKKYDSYLQAKLITAPTRVRVKTQGMVLFFFWACGPSTCPGFLYNPYAWINRVTIEPGNQFGLQVRKLPFRKFPYFMKEDSPNSGKEIKHENKVNISGNIWSGYEFRLTK